MKKRGLIVYPHLPHYRLGVFKELDKFDDFEFVYAASESGINGIRTVSPGAVKRFSRLRNVYMGKFLWQIGLFRAFSRERPDFVIFLADPHYLSSGVLALWCRALRRPVFFWTHGWTKQAGGTRDLVKKVYFRLADSLLLYGNVGKSFGVESGFPEHRMTVIYNSIASGHSERDENQEESEIARDISSFCADHPHVIGAVARLQDVKSLDQIIEAAAHIRKTKPEFSSLGVVLVGEGPEREALKTLARQLQVPTLMPGAAYSHGELQRFYQSVQVTVMPDRAGLTAIQSLSYGVPVVSNSDANGQMPEWESIRPGMTGELFEKGDCLSLADAIVRLMSGPRQTEACLEEYRSRWSPESQARAIKEFLTSYFVSD